MITIKKVYHQGADSMGLFFGYNEDLNQGAVTTGAVWSRTLRCQQRDDDAENYRKLKEVFPDHTRVKNTDSLPLAPAPGLKNSHDTAPIVDANSLNARLRPAAQERKLEKPEPARADTAFLYTANKYWVMPTQDSSCKSPRATQAVFCHSTQEACMVYGQIASYSQLSQKPSSRNINPSATLVADLNTTISLHQKPKSDKFMGIFTSYRQV
jgi:hypothetical protein